MSNVIDLSKYKKKTEAKTETKIPSKQSTDPQFGDRLVRIRASLEKINSLMEELKRMSSSHVDKSKT